MSIEEPIRAELLGFSGSTLEAKIRLRPDLFRACEKRAEELGLEIGGYLEELLNQVLRVLR